MLLVFGADVAWRAFQRKSLAPRTQRATPICWSIVVVAVLLTWVPSHVRPIHGSSCSGSLIWWTTTWADIGVVIISALITLYAVVAAIITQRSLRNAKTDRVERRSSSRAVCYLAIGTMMMVCHHFAFDGFATHNLKLTCPRSFLFPSMCVHFNKRTPFSSLGWLKWC